MNCKIKNNTLHIRCDNYTELQAVESWLKDVKKSVQTHDMSFEVCKNCCKLGEALPDGYYGCKVDKSILTKPDWSCELWVK